MLFWRELFSELDLKPVLSKRGCNVCKEDSAASLYVLLRRDPGQGGFLPILPD